MDQYLKENWPKLAVGVAGIALSYAAYKGLSSEKAIDKHGQV